MGWEIEEESLNIACYYYYEFYYYQFLGDD